MKKTYIKIKGIQIIGIVILLLLAFTPQAFASDSTLNYQITKPDLTPEGDIKTDVKWVYDDLQAYLKEEELKADTVEVNYLTHDDESLVLVAINSTDKTVKELENVTISLGEIENKEIVISQSNLGSLEPQSAYPIIVELSEEEAASLDEHAADVEIGDYTVKYTDKSVFWKFYIVNLIFSIIAYKLGFARELPLGKSIFVYVMLVVGVFVLTIFSLMNLPITESLIIISLVLAIYRYRMHVRRKKKNEA